MINFYWNLRSLRKDLEYENVVSRRTIVTVIFAGLLYLFLAFSDVFETKFGLISSAIIVSLVMVFSLSVALVSLNFNKKDYKNSVESTSIFSITNDGVVKVDTHEFSFLNIVNVIETDFKGVTPLNASDLVCNGKYIGIFVKDLDLKSHGGGIKVINYNHLVLLYIPLRYVDNSDLLVETLKGKCFDYGVQWNSYIDAVSMGRSIVDFNSNHKVVA